MNKRVALAFVVAITIAFCLTLMPKVFSQIEDVRVLSYSWYISPSSFDYLVAVGEVQNIGQNVIEYVKVIGTFYASDGTPLAENSVKSFATQILPQQKTPFYMLFSPSDSLTGDSLDPQNIEKLSILVSYAEPTDSSQYEDLEISSHSSSTNPSGYYGVTGVVKNTGTQSATQVGVIATFYDSTGSVAGIAYTDLTPSSIAPGGTASFTIYPMDYSAVINKISSYSLLIEAPNTTPSATPTPSPGISPSPSPTPTETGNGTDTPDTDLYTTATIVIIVAAICIFAVGLFALLRRKRV